jgi:hypothetical protein
VLEEIARFLSDYAYVNERQKKYNNSNTERDSLKGGANSNRDSIPDWVPYAESSIANRSNRDLSNSNTDDVPGGFRDDSYGRESAARSATSSPAIPTVPEQNNRSLRPRHPGKQLQRTIKTLWKLPSSFWRSSNKGKSRRHNRPSWRADEMTEEFSISVVQPEELNRSADRNEVLERQYAPF